MSIENIDNVLRKLENLKRIREEVVTEVNLGLTAIEGSARDNASGPRPDHIDKVTSNLVSGIHTTGVSVSGSIISGEVESSALYSGIHENGGFIEAKNAPFLTFQLPDGTWRKAPAVTIPARPFMEPALREHEDQIWKNLLALTGRLLK